MCSLFAVLLACASYTAPATTPPVIEEAPAAVVPIALTVRAVYRECGPNDGPVIRVYTEDPDSLSPTFDLPDPAEVGAHTSTAYSDAGRWPVEVTVESNAEGHLKAQFTLPDLDGAPASGSIDAAVQDITGGCG